MPTANARSAPDDLLELDRAHAMLTMLAMLLLGSATAEARTPPACTPPAIELFSCTAGRRTIAVYSEDGETVYRSFRDGDLELRIPGGVPLRFGYSGGGEQQMAFTNRDVQYVVYERTVRTSFGDHHDAAFDAGVTVGRAGRTIATIHCDDPDTTFSRLGQDVRTDAGGK